MRKVLSIFIAACLVLSLSTGFIAQMPSARAAVTDKAITAFNFNALTPPVIGVVNEIAKTVTLTVPFGTVVTALVPTITITGALVSPASGVAHDFTVPVTYTVAAADASTQAYLVIVAFAPNPSILKAITAFNFNALTPPVIGVVNEIAKTVTLTVPFGTVVTALVPTITITGALVSPASGVAANFTVPVVYTVAAADASTQAYLVIVTFAPNPATLKAITAFNFNALTPPVIGVVNETTKTVTLTVPFGTVVTALVPTITITGALVSPASGVAHDFTIPVTYTVAAADASTQAYVVTVTIAPNPVSKTITAFSFNALTPPVAGVVNETTKTVLLTVPFGTVVTALVPTITITGASVSPASGLPANFTSPVVYTVTAIDASTQAYTVIVTVAANTASKAITAFNFNALTPAVVAAINETDHTIALAVPLTTVVTALVPTITITGVSVSPATGLAHDFTNPVAYIVTAADASTLMYTVTVYKPFTLTYTAGVNGTITGTTPQTVNYGANGTAVTAVPNAGYHFVQWSDGFLNTHRTDIGIDADLNVTATFAINPPATADLSITKTVDNATPLVGANVTFTIIVSNHGPDTATNVSVTDTLPAGLTYVSSTPTGAYNSTTHVWAIGTLANAASAALSITATVTQTGAITNAATATVEQTDATPANNTASVAVNAVTPPVGLHLNPLALPLQIFRTSEIVVDESWTDGTAPFTWSVNFGDGSAAVTGTSTDRRLVVRHLYTAAGTYTVGVTVTDSTGKTGSVSQTLTAVDSSVSDEVYHHTFFVGYPDGMFKPERNVSRAEVATSLSRALGLGWSDTNPSFPDVPATHWASGYIQIMVDEGIMEGDASGTFRPDAFITRAEAAAVLLRTLKVEPFHNLLSSSFNDVPATHWALGYIESMQKYGLITGYPDGAYKPDAHILRSEFTAIADRGLGREISASSQVTGLSGDVRWPDVPANHWAYLYILEASTPHTVEQANRLNRSIVLKSKTIPLFSDGTSAVTIRKVGDILTAIVPVDGLRPDGSAPVARKVTVVVTIKLAP